MIHPEQAVHRRQAAEYDDKALRARTPAESRAYRRQAQESRLQAILAGMDQR